ncbi:MAG: HD domain-containing protein [Dehalococcoidales bacterium]|nr:MAG: HD domain-containing protein [Dehalococcoidales bacterium]
MDSELIQRISTIIEDACKAETNTFGYGIWSHHILPMISIAQELADRTNAAKKIVTLAVLLHDYAGIKDQELVEEHHIWGAKEAEIILANENLDEEKIEQVKKCILAHRGSVIIEKTTEEEKCVADADAIVHIDQLASLFYLVYGDRGMDVDEGRRWVKDKLTRDWEKMSENGRNMIKKKYDCIMELLEE